MRERGKRERERERERERVGGYIVDCYGNSRQEKERVDS
jgi:hypothetical protein